MSSSNTDVTTKNILNFATTPVISSEKLKGPKTNLELEAEEDSEQRRTNPAAKYSFTRSHARKEGGAWISRAAGDGGAWRRVRRRLVVKLSGLVRERIPSKVAQISERNSFVSEYTHMVMLEFEIEKGNKRDTKPAKANEKEVRKEIEEKMKINNSNCSKIIVIQSLGLGFGDLEATADNTPPGLEIIKLPEAAEKFMRAASSCCDTLCGCWCCPVCIQVCSGMNNQFAIVLTQFCGALACLGCLSCCEFCCD